MRGESGLARCDLTEQVNVGDGILDVSGQVGDLPIGAGGVVEMVVDPADEDLFGREFEQVLDGLIFSEQHDQAWVLRQVDVAQ